MNYIDTPYTNLMPKPLILKYEFLFTDFHSNIYLLLLQFHRDGIGDQEHTFIDTYISQPLPIITMSGALYAVN